MPLDVGNIMAVGKGLFNRLKDTFTETLGEEVSEPIQEPVVKEEEEKKVVAPDVNPDIDTIHLRIQQAGRSNVLLWLNYQREGANIPVARHVEPYSYRPAQQNSDYPLFMAFDHKDNRTKAFILERIKGIMVTDIPFNPKYDVEF